MHPPVDITITFHTPIKTWGPHAKTHVAEVLSVLADEIEHKGEHLDTQVLTITLAETSAQLTLDGMPEVKRYRYLHEMEEGDT